MNLQPDRSVMVDGRKEKVRFRTRTISQLATAMEFAQAHSEEHKERRASVDGDKRFTATKNIGEYIDMFRHGWKAGVKDMKELAGITSEAADSLMFKRAPGGAFPIVPAHLAGHPDSMLMATVDVNENKRGITLVVDSCFSGDVNSRTIIEYAKEIMRLVAWLKAEQLDVSVYAVVPIRMGSKRVVYTTPIIESGDVFQPERIASTLHPSFLRRAWFSMVEYEFYETDDKFPECSVCRGGYGCVTNVSIPELREALPTAHAVCLLPKPGEGDPRKAIDEVLNLKIRTEG